MGGGGGTICVVCNKKAYSGETVTYEKKIIIGIVSSVQIVATKLLLAQHRVIRASHTVTNVIHPEVMPRSRRQQLEIGEVNQLAQVRPMDLVNMVGEVLNVLYAKKLLIQLSQLNIRVPYIM